MKNFARKLLSVLLATAMAAGCAVTALAAETTAATAAATAASDYSVKFQDGNKMIYTQNGKTYTYKVKNTDVTLTTDKDGDFLVCYYNADGDYRAMSLEKQTSLTISGALASLTLNESLAGKTTINLYANVDNLSVETANKVNVYGKVATMNVSAAATITVKNGGVVSVQTLRTSKATVSVEKGGSIVKSNTVTDPQPEPQKEPTSSKRSYRLNISTIYTESGTRLSELRDELNNRVTAYDSKNNEYVSGTAIWVKSGSTTVEKDGTYSFKFNPDSSRYASTTGKVTICVDEVHGYASLVYVQDSFTFSPYQTLGEFQYALEGAVYAVDNYGNYVSGTLKWNDGVYTVVEDGNYYGFTFIPSSSKYRRIEGSLRAMSALPQGNTSVDPYVDDNYGE